MAPSVRRAIALRALVGTAGLLVGLVLAALVAARGCLLLAPADLEELRRARELEERGEGQFRRAVAKVQLAQAVIDGRLTLLEAAAHGLALSRRPPAFAWGDFRRNFPGGSDEESQCRALIALIEVILEQEDPCLALTIPAGLERELRRHLRRGPLRLPGAFPAEWGDQTQPPVVPAAAGD